MSEVQNLVCPACSRMHTRDHADGCPRAMADPDPAYVEGWMAARVAFGEVARMAADEARKDCVRLIDEFPRMFRAALPKL